ncbi:MAG: glycosyltransferase family 2 protein [Betaproteobacteria bacterium]|jgi:glycosyltransferase involved in cell wall biosynthesis|nr:glycosyltransferase family 2 protein [Rhodocyclaceae bacterium]MCA3133304.1 glycosyltransferase family 2 protein [Rhodocyclaceae bacterium]MCA3142215.1 glycosyltransferase family 2 protein [Rhodocyclaceae bacterium]MCA3146496.1 glycosyltransferase family 2 protein [Rhodocyclaceae bacterium]MCE2897208.1 glycosyltransferase family 2 protein [Betaproteobacteria bacterium]
MQRIPVSCVIITRDAAAPLPAALASVQWCEDVVVVDSGSRDETCAIAERAGARVVHQDWLGFGPQKRFAVSCARHDWVLCLDADERVSPELRVAMERALAAPSHGAYQFARCNRFLGRWLRHGEGYPDWSLRLFDRREAQWSQDPVHEKVLARVPVGRLAGDLLHESAESLTRYLEKQNRYTSLQAEAAFVAGTRFSAAKLVLSPLMRFVKFYFLRLGFLDGAAGLVHIAIGCQNSFLKHAKLLELERRGGAQ